MTLVPTTDTVLGPLEISEVFFEHDGPRLFVAQNRAGNLYLANCVDEDEEEYTETYLYVSVSRDRMNLVRSGYIPLREVYTQAEDRFVYKITAEYGKADPGNRLETIPADQIQDDWLPLAEARLEIATETLPSFNPEKFRADSEGEFRTRIALEIFPVDMLRTEVSLRSMSRLAGSFQDTVDSLAQEERGRPTARGLIPEEILQESELVFTGAQAASFVMVLAPKSSPTLIGHDLVNKSTGRLLELLQAADSQEELTRLLGGYGIRARSKFRSLLTMLSDDETGAGVFLADHRGQLSVAKIGLESVRNALSIIDNRSPDSEKLELSRVTLVGVNLRTGIFELFDNVAGQRYSGQMAPDAKVQISGLPTGEEHFYTASLLKTMEYSTMTTDVSSSYRLLYIRPVNVSL
ncbi:DUF6575 domain-containing protein [Arthrobacter sp. H14-L1]|uniref:DUF6575 domain-containing protein n=1 Tax=Arthrobacter sp. H14-L1 TaxID=2996697 RepID=UPI00226F45D6|nr:DUF6575 domain-containing protein [Arthrobacter sp. H14-L1]MCY0905801.1 hypothetical protein [Arthrobacter sp. H14-L1]